MSEPLYRIWSIEHKRYILNNDFYVNLEGHICYIQICQQDEYFIPERCTGEIVNGEYIYEGDIIKVGEDMCTVEFCYGNFTVNSINTYKEYELDDIDKIIGKVLQNPEMLLEKEEE